MLEIMYSPEDVGKEVINSHGRMTTIRKYHMTEEDKISIRNKWLKVIKNVNKRTKERAGDKFYNPYRKGIYYYQIYSLFLLGCNKWHNLSNIIDKMEAIMSQIVVKKDDKDITAWDKFRGKSSRDRAIKCKDFKGRIQENMVFFQRLNKLHPTGYKLRQVCCAVDVKRVSRKGFPNGCYYYRLSTYDQIDQALPIKDYSRFKFPKHERKYVNYKFLGTIITSDKIIIEGEVHDMSSV